MNTTLSDNSKPPAVGAVEFRYDAKELPCGHSERVGPMTAVFTRTRGWVPIADVVAAFDASQQSNEETR